MRVRAQHLILGTFLLAATPLGTSAAEAASLFYRDDEIVSARALRARVMERVPGLAAAVDPATKAPLRSEVAVDILRELATAGRAEADNPFYYWAMGEVRRRAGDAGAATEFARAAAAAQGQPLIHWLLWEAYLDRGQLPEADAELSALQGIYLGWGLMRFPHLAQRLVQGARSALARDGFQEAALLLERSMEIDPSQPAPHFVMARLLWQQDKGNIFPAIRSLVGGIVLACRSRESRRLVLGNVLGDVSHALTIGLGALAALLAFRCYSLAGHDARHGVRQRLTAAEQVAVLLAFLLPFALGFGILWAILLVLLLCAPYISGRERLAVSILLLAFVLLPCVYRVLAHDNLVAGSPRAILAQQVEAGARGEGTLAQARQWATQEPRTFVPAYLLGLVQKRRGDLAEAERGLRHATELAPEQSAPWVALSNVRYLQGDKDGALETYARAGAPAAGSALAHRNQALIYLERLEFERGRQELAEASRLDSRLVSAVPPPRLARAGTVLADEPLRDAELLDALAPSPPQEKALAAALAARMLWPVPLQALPFLIGAVLLAFWGVVRWGGEIGQARACPECGQVFCRRCQMAAPAEPFCAACAAVQLRQGITASSRVQRRREVEAFRERRRRIVRILGICLPGAAHLYLRRPLGGLLLLLPALFLLSQVFVGTLFWRPLPLPRELGGLLGALTGVPLLLVLWGLSAWRGPRLTPPEGA